MGENFQVSLGAWQQFAVRRAPLLTAGKQSPGRGYRVGGLTRLPPGQPGCLAAVCGAPPASFHSRQARGGARSQGQGPDMAAACKFAMHVLGAEEQL